MLQRTNISKLQYCSTSPYRRGGGEVVAGNVLTVFSDKKHTLSNNHTTPYIVSTTDYDPFGMIMNGRNWNAGEYRFGFNGKENDNEVKGTGNQQDYGMRIYDPLIGKFLSVDPLTMSYPWYTPYQFAGNTPIQAIDLDGLEPWYVTGHNTNTTINYPEGSSITSNIEYSGTIYGPYKDQGAANQAAASGDLPLSDYSFTSQFTKTSYSGINRSITKITEIIKSGYYPLYTPGGINTTNNSIEGGYSNGFDANSYSFLNGRSTGSGACYSIGVGEAFAENFVRQPLQSGLEGLGMSENAAYWTSSGLTLAGSIVLGKVATKGGSSWSLTKEGATTIKFHNTWGNMYKSKSDGLWWAVDKTGHGPSKFKVFKETNKGLEWFKDADKFGDFIINKHKSSTGKFIPWGELNTVK